MNHKSMDFAAYQIAYIPRRIALLAVDTWSVFIQRTRHSKKSRTFTEYHVPYQKSKKEKAQETKPNAKNIKFV
jgi:hypothetical protein